MQKTCVQCNSGFEIADTDLAFYETVSPVFNGKKELIPPPRCCPDCRERQRWIFQNQRFLYHRNCDRTGKPMVSAYSPDKKLTVYKRDEWLKIDNTDAGRDFDFSRPFFEQFGELFRSTPKASVLQTGEMLNSDYAHFVGWQKNCYMVFDAGKNEDCMYDNFMGYCKNCVDCMDLQYNELCYDCVELNDCYGLRHGTFCKNCSNSAFLFDCIGCKNCLGCINLRNKEYCVFNEFVGKERFEQMWKEVFNGSAATYEAMRKRWREFELSQPHRALHHINTTSSTGDYLIGCENLQDCYKCVELRDSKWCQYVVLKCNDLRDISAFGESLEFSYQLAACGGLAGKLGMSNCLFNAYVYYGASNVHYSIHCHDNCRDCFGCCDIRGKRHCILNKQYTEAAYHALVPKIIEHMRKTGEWGEFFPMSLSLFGYNESLAQDYFPLTREEALKKGFTWKEPDHKEYQKGTYALPDRTADVPDTVAQETLACVECSRNYRVIKQELDFYRGQSLPLPRHCPQCRYLQRLTRRNPERRWDRQCAKCKSALQTSYAPDRQEIVYCEKCYQAAVY